MKSDIIKIPDRDALILKRKSKITSLYSILTYLNPSFIITDNFYDFNKTETVQVTHISNIDKQILTDCKSPENSNKLIKLDEKKSIISIYENTNDLTQTYKILILIQTGDILQPINIENAPPFTFLPVNSFTRYLIKARSKENLKLEDKEYVKCADIHIEKQDIKNFNLKYTKTANKNLTLRDLFEINKTTDGFLFNDILSLIFETAVCTTDDKLINSIIKDIKRELNNNYSVNGIPDLTISKIINNKGIKNAAIEYIGNTIKPKFDTATAISLFEFKLKNIIDDKSFRILRQRYYDNKIIKLISPGALANEMIIQLNNKRQKPISDQDAIIVQDYVKMCLDANETIKIHLGLKALKEEHDRLAELVTPDDIPDFTVDPKFMPVIAEFEKLKSYIDITDIKHIENKTDLSHNAKIMKNCTAGYAYKINDGYADLWFLKYKKRMFNIEINIRYGKYSIVQVEGYNNQHDLKTNAIREELLSLLEEKTDLEVCI